MTLHSRANDHLPNPNSRYNKVSFDLLSKVLQDSSNIYTLFLLPLLPPRGSLVPIAEDMHFRYRTQRGVNWN